MLLVLIHRALRRMDKDKKEWKLFMNKYLKEKEGWKVGRLDECPERTPSKEDTS
ncbi:MAG: hypothetical protein HY063_14635 [Bacteroidetes bacterium]|nr:hypothetical protein [Bacteroidota bacterium]